MNGPTDIDVSVVIPCFNEAPHLRRCAETVICTLGDLRYRHEIIFVDDGSADETLLVLESICAGRPQCRIIAHGRNRGRGAAVKTGFAEAHGRIVGFIDIDLQIAPHYIGPLIREIDSNHADIAVAVRNSTDMLTPKAAGRWLMSRGYQVIRDFALGLELTDTESGCKFFNRETAVPAVLGSIDDRWFWDTEVIARAALLNLKIHEVPVLFGRSRKPTTVRVVRDSLRQLAALHHFRAQIGMSITTKSPIYWSPWLYDKAMDWLYQHYSERVLAEVARRVPAGASVVDVCCGTARLGSEFLLEKQCSYVGLDFNGAFVRNAQRRGVDARQFNLLVDGLPRADYIVMCSSLYHFYRHADDVLAALRNAARKHVIVSEPVNRFANGALSVTMRGKLTNPGIGDAGYRYDVDEFRGIAARHGVSEFCFRQGDWNATAVFPSASR